MCRREYSVVVADSNELCSHFRQFIAVKYQSYGYELITCQKQTSIKQGLLKPAMRSNFCNILAEGFNQNSFYFNLKFSVRSISQRESLFSLHRIIFRVNTCVEKARIISILGVSFETRQEGTAVVFQCCILMKIFKEYTNLAFW